MPSIELVLPGKDKPIKIPMDEVNAMGWDIVPLMNKQLSEAIERKEKENASKPSKMDRSDSK